MSHHRECAPGTPCGVCGEPSKDGLPHVDCLTDEVDGLREERDTAARTGQALAKQNTELRAERDSAIAWANEVHECVLEAVDDHAPGLGQSLPDFIRHRLNTTATQYEYAAFRQMLVRARELEGVEATLARIAGQLDDAYNAGTFDQTIAGMLRDEALAALARPAHEDKEERGPA